MSFVNPGAWVLAGSFAVLIALYLWEQTKRRIEVPSLLLWQLVPEAPRRHRRFMPDWLFVLQAAALALLIAGLADPFFTAAPEPTSPAAVVLILDRSASMGANEGHNSRFDLARAALGRRLDSLSSVVPVMLIGTAQRPQVIAPFTRDRDAVRRHLAELEPLDVGGSLDAALALAARAAADAIPPAQVELFTDTPRERLAEPWRSTVAVTQVGESDDNLAIAALQVKQSRFQAGAHAFVAVRNFAHREAHGVLTLQLDHAILSRRGFSVAPRTTRGFAVPSLPAAGVLRAALDVDDALAADNIAYAEVRPTRVLRTLAVTDSETLAGDLRRIAAATSNLRVEVVPSADYRGTGEADIVIFHRLAPPLPPGAASLYIAPEGTAGPFPSRGPFANVPLLDGNERHPVLAGVRPELPFPLTAASDLAAPPWADRLLTARDGDSEIAVAVAGESGGRRHAALGFDLAENTLLAADHVDLLVLFLNLLDWLAPADNAVRIVRTGETTAIDSLPAEPRRLTDPRGRESRLPADTAVRIDAEYAGEYGVTADGTAVRVFANFVDAEESDIGRAPRPATDETPARLNARRMPAPRHGFGSWIMAAAGIILFAEWFAARRVR